MKKSYVKFSLIGAYCEELISAAINDNIKIYDLKNDGNIIYGKTALYNYKRLAVYARQYKVRMRQVEKKGLAIRIMPYKKRFGLGLGILFYAGIIVFCSSFVWDIRISGNTTVSDTLLLETLAENGIKAGALNDTLKCKNTEFKTLLAIDKLAWISIENEGSRIYVKVSERLDEEAESVPIGTPCNVIASKSGVIVETQVYRGTMLCSVGSGVAEGDIIVSGVVNDGAGNLSYNHANALIIADYKETASFFIPFTETKTVNTGNVREKEYIQFFSFTLPTENITAQENWIYKTEDHLVTVLGIQMPWKIRKVIATETKEIEVTHTVDRVKELLLEEKAIYEKNYFSDAEILDAEIQYISDDDGITMEVTYTLRGNIAQLKEISIN